MEEIKTVENSLGQPTTTFDSGFSKINVDAVTENINTKDLYTYGGEKLGYITRYPEYATWRDNESYMAEKQGVFGTLANTVSQFAGLAGVTIGNAISGYGREFDTYMSGNLMTEMGSEDGLELALRQRAYQDLYPIYETAAQRERRDKETDGLFDSATSAIGQFINPFGEGSRVGNAWANLFGQLGFTAGTIAVVGAESLAISAVTGGTASSFAALRGAKTLKSLYSAIKQGKNLTTATGLGKHSPSLLSRAIDNPVITGYRMIKTAKDEAWVEAQSSRLEFVESQIEAERKRLGRELTQEELQEIDDRSLALAGGVYLQNIPIVAFGNLLTIGGTFKPKNFLTSPAMPREIRGKVIKGIPNLSDKSFYNSVMKDFPKVKKTFDTVGKYRPRTGVKESFGEGMEEFLQGVSSRAGEHYYDMLNSDVSAGLFGHTMGMFGEAFESIQSKEGWDEMMSGILTGVIIGQGGKIVNRVSGRTSRENELAKQGIDEFTRLNGAFFNTLVQQQSAIQSQEKTDSGDIKGAKDIDTHAELSLIKYLRKYGIFDEYVDAMAANFAELAAAENTDLKDVLGDTSIDSIVNSLKRKNQEFTKAFNTIDKNVSNPFATTDPKHRIYEEVKANAAAMEVMSKDSINRANKLVREIREEYSEIDQTLIDIINDPSTIKDKYNTLAKTVEVEEELLKNAELSKIDRETRQEELRRSKDKLKVVEKLKNEVDSEKGLKADFLNRQVLEAAFGEEGAAPSNFKRMLKDIAELNAEGLLYMEAYNRLTNAETFEKFAKNFTDGYELRIREAKARVDKIADEAMPILSKQQAKEETENEEVKDFIDDLSYDAETEKYSINGQEYDSIEEAAANNGLTDEILSTQNEQGKTNREIINQTDYSEPLENEEGLLTPQAANESLKEEKSKVEGMSNEDLAKKVSFVDKPKTKQDSENSYFGFIPKVGNSILHNFSVAVSFFTDYSSTQKRAEKIGDKKLINDLQEAIDNINDKDYTITNISLIKEKKEWKSKNDSNIQIVYDGIRYFVVTRGKQDQAAGIIEDKLKIKLSPNRNSPLILDENGSYVVSNFLETDAIKEREESIAKVKEGTKLKVRVADTDFNKNLRAEYEKSDGKEAAENNYISKLELEVIDNDNNTYGTIRAGDFFYLSDGEERILDLVRDNDLVGLGINKVVDGIEAIAQSKRNLRGFNYNEKGELIYTPLNEFQENLAEGKAEFFFVGEDEKIYNEKGEVESTKELTGRATLSKGAVYMKVTDGNGAIDVSQVFKGDDGGESFTLQEFTDPSFKENATTNVSPTTPIASQRLEVRLQEASPNFNESIQEDIEDRVEKIKESVDTTEQERELNQKAFEEMDEFNKMLLDTELIPIGERGSVEEKNTELINDARDDSQYDQKKDNLSKNPDNLSAQRGVIAEIEKIVNHENFDKKNVKNLISGNGILEKIEGLKETLKEIKEVKEEGKVKEVNKVTQSFSVEINDLPVTIPQGTVYNKEENTLTPPNGTPIKVSEITKVIDEAVEQETEDTSSEQQEVSEPTTFQNLTEFDEIIDYLKNNAIIGQPLTNVAGDTFTLIEEKDDTRLIRVEDSQGEFYLAIKGNQVQNVSFDNEFFAAFDTVFDTLPFDLRGELEPDSLVKAFNKAASKYAPNLGESLLIALREAYVEALRRGEHTINLGTLVELSDMTQDEKDIFNSLLPSSLHAPIIRYITKSEVVYNRTASQLWNSVRESVGLDAEYLELSDPALTPKDKYEQAVESRMSKLEETFNSIGIKLSLPKKLVSNETKSKIVDTLKSALDKDTYKEAYKEVKKGLAETGTKVTNTMSRLKEVTENLLGYNVEEDYIHTFSRQLEEMKNGRVADSNGNYVEVNSLSGLETSLPKVTQTYQALQNKGIDIPLEVIAAHLKVNGTLSSLMTAVNKHNKALERKDAKEITVVRGGKGFIVTKTRKDIIKFNGNNYLPFGTDKKGNVVYYNPSDKNAYENITRDLELVNKETNGVDVSKQAFDTTRNKNKTENKVC